MRLGQGVDQTRAFHPDAMRRTLKTLQDYAQTCIELGVKPAAVRAITTSSARDAKNSKQFFERVKQETGFKFRVISGKEEARMTFRGALLPGMLSSKTAVIDIGGGSTELFSSAGGESLDIGSVRFTERYLRSDPVSDPEFWACEKAVDDQIQGLIKRGFKRGSRELVGVAGTVTTLATWFLDLSTWDAAKVDGTELYVGDVHRMVEELKWRTVEERKALTGIESGRADVLLAGAMILWRAMEILGFPKVTVSTRGLRFGALF